MRKRRAQGQQAAASGAFSWVVFYAFRSLFRRGLDNLSRLPTDRAGKALSRLGFHRLKMCRQEVSFPLPFCLFLPAYGCHLTCPILTFYYSYLLPCVLWANEI